MKKEACFYLGKVVSKYSFRGEVLLKLDADDPEQYQELESVFLERQGTLVPFLIQKCRLHKSNLLRLTLEGVDTEAEADGIIGAGAYLPLEMLPPLEGDKFYYHEVVGFRVNDRKRGHVGILRRIEDNGPQAIAYIEWEGREWLLPINDDSILEVDRSNGVLHVAAPEGLIDLYL